LLKRETQERHVFSEKAGMRNPGRGVVGETGVGVDESGGGKGADVRVVADFGQVVEEEGREEAV
jgi:hypothetical protein